MIQVRTALRRAGQQPKTLRLKDGSRLLLLPHGGRVLGLFSAKNEANFYWTNPLLENAIGARSLFSSTGWHNSGGDRTWLAPEVDFFLPNFPALDRYHQQKALDPGQYQFVERDGKIELQNRFIVQFSRSGEKAKLQLNKSFAPALNPLRNEKHFNSARVEYAGYTQSVSLAFVGKKKAICPPVGLWSLIQMPSGGELVIPTFSKSEPRHVFSTTGGIAPEDLTVTEQAIHYRMRQDGEHKISLRAVSVCGRAGYIKQEGKHWTVVVRNFSVNPSGEYVDVPWNEPTLRGFAVQACNVRSALGKFAELEYHTPAIGQGTGRTACTDTAQVWAYRGPRADILRIAKCLVGDIETV